MRVIIQRVKSSSVSVEDKVVGKIGKGYMLLVGFDNQDHCELIDKMVDKIIGLRIFEDESEKMNRSIQDVGGQILSISQFTLYANCKKGRRPSFVEAAKGEDAICHYDYFNDQLKQRNIHVEQGIFGANMQVSLINDGPITVILDSEKLFTK